MGDQQIQDLVALAFDKWTLLTAGGVFFLLRVLGQTPLSRLSIYRRAMPVLPELLGVFAAFFGGIPTVADSPIALKIAAGLWCGYLSQRTHKILGQTILGDDPQIAPKTSMVGLAPKPEPPAEGG